MKKLVASLTSALILRPSGKVLIDGEVYSAVAETGFITRGSAITVRREEQGHLYVVVSGQS